MSEDRATIANPRPIHPFLAWLIGAGAAVVGLIPWLVTGLRLPLQNLWAHEVLPAEMPIALLPFSQYSTVLLAAMLIVPYGIGGLVARATRARTPHGAGWIWLGTFSVQLVASVQTAAVVWLGLQQRWESFVYFVAVLGVIVAAILVGLLVLVLTARARPGGAVVGFAIAGIALGEWLPAALQPLTAARDGLPQPLGIIVMTAGGILIGAAIAWAGLRTPGRIVAGIVSLALLWVAGPLLTAIAASTGSRVLARFPGDMLDYGLGVLRMALFIPEIVLPPLIAAVVVAAIGLIVRGVAGRRHPVMPPAAPVG